MGEWPFISIVVPTYARPAHLTRCLRSLVALDYPRDRFEVIIVDDGSEPPIDSEIKPFREQLTISCLRQNHLGVSQARNNGATAACGNFVAFTDDDCRVDPEWLKELALAFQQTPEKLVGGKILNGLPDNIFSHASQLLITYLYSRFNGDPDRSTFITSNNMAIPKREFLEMGGFDTTATLTAEDRLFCHEWIMRGHQIRYVPTAIIHHENRSTLKDFWQQQFKYGKGAYYFRKYRASTDKRTIEPLNFYWQLLFYPFKIGWGFFAWKLFLLFVLSQFATLLGYLYQKFRS
jgi:cellulose synthase/poly-beta-1,6-N-acetylglucosamine synthase-like glycosyltransferase